MHCRCRKRRWTLIIRLSLSPFSFKGDDGVVVHFQYCEKGNRPLQGRVFFFLFSLLEPQKWVEPFPHVPNCSALFSPLCCLHFGLHDHLRSSLLSHIKLKWMGYLLTRKHVLLTISPSSVLFFPTLSQSLYSLSSLLPVQALFFCWLEMLSKKFALSSPSGGKGSKTHAKRSVPEIDF